MKLIANEVSQYITPLFYKILSAIRNLLKYLSWTVKIHCTF